MHRPIDGPFHGSTHADEVADIELTRTLTSTFSSIAILVSVVTALAVVGACLSADPLCALKAASLILLVGAVCGLYATRRAEDAVMGSIRRIYGSVFRRLAHPGACAVRDVQEEDACGVLAGLVASMALRSWKLAFESASSERKEAALSGALQKGRQQAQHVASQARQDAGSLAETAAELDFITERRARELANAVQSLDLAEASMECAIGRLAGLTEAVQSIAASAGQMTVVAVALSHLTRSAQREIGESDERTATLMSALHNVKHAEVSNADAPYISIDADLPQADVLNLSSYALVLGSASDTMRRLIAQVASVDRRTVEMSNLLLSMRELGEGLEQVVQRQGNEIAQTLNEFYEARQGFTTLKASLRSVIRSGESQQGMTEELRLTASRLPERAERLASLMCSIPDFVRFSEH